MNVAIVHDYLTQRGGAERVVLSMMRAFPDAQLHTALYAPDSTFPEFRGARIRTLALNRIAILRRNHRLALPALAAAFDKVEVEADVVLCSSSGWAHGIRTSGRKIVYCHNPARWLYQRDAYVRGRNLVERGALGACRPWLERWDRRSAASAARYLVNSRVVRQRVVDLYGIDADVVPPPHTIDADGPRRPVPQVQPGYVLAVSRMLPYKNLDAIARAINYPHGPRVVIVGTGPEQRRIAALAGEHMHMVGAVDDQQLRWLYANSIGLVAASYEDYGLTPLEAAAFGKPSAVLRWGGYLDTMVEGETGVFFDHVDPVGIRTALTTLRECQWDDRRIRTHAMQFNEEAFIQRLRRIAAEPSDQSSEGHHESSSIISRRG